jgi:flagellar motor switch protein FliN/FliY
MSSSPISLSSSSAEAPAAAVPAFLGDVECAVDFLVGTARISVRECLALEAGSVVKLRQSAGADVEIRVQGVTLARGEVAIIDELTALRISSIAPAPGVEEP